MADNNLILMIEDDEANATMMFLAITQETSYWVMRASDAMTAWNILRHLKPHLIIVDERLPGASGMVFYRQLRANYDLQDIPVFFVCAAFPSRKLMRSGVAILEKPFGLDDFLYLVDELIAVS